MRKYLASLDRARHAHAIVEGLGHEPILADQPRERGYRGDRIAQRHPEVLHHIACRLRADINEHLVDGHNLATLRFRQKMGRAGRDDAEDFIAAAGENLDAL